MIPLRHIIMRTVVVLAAATSGVAAWLHLPIWVNTVCVAICGIMVAVSAYMVRRSWKALKELDR